MTNTSIAPAEPVLVVIDTSKTRHEVLIAVASKKRRRRLTVSIQLEDFNWLTATLLEYGDPFVPLNFSSTVESSRTEQQCWIPSITIRRPFPSQSPQSILKGSGLSQ